MFIKIKSKLIILIAYLYVNEINEKVIDCEVGIKNKRRWIFFYFVFV